MSSRGENDLCRICSGALLGTQRRWLFGGHNNKSRPSPSHTPTGGGSLRGRSLSVRSSPWGSTLSLGSSVSSSKSSHSSPSKAVDLLSVLTHILGQSVPRGHGEFVCGKCVCALERVFKFDSVIARVRVLSSERLQRLLQERDRLRQWVRHNYRHRIPADARRLGSTSEEDGDEKEGYREMLRDNMALSEYECWSEKWDTCPYFIRTGKRCRKGKGCEGCDSLRVSDSDYESVCGVPRCLQLRSFSPASSRDKSATLRWHRVNSSTASSPASLAGSSLSLRASSRAASVCRSQSSQSLDSLDGDDDDDSPFESPHDRSVHLVLTELKALEGRALSSPAGSRIPVLDKKDGKFSGKLGQVASPTIKVLDFGELENGENGRDEEDEDVLTELRDEFVPLQRQSAGGRVHRAARSLRGQLDQAAARIRSLEAQLEQGRGKPAEVNGSDWAPLLDPEEEEEEDGGSEGRGLLLQSLARSLRSRGRLIQEFMVLIQRLCEVDGHKLTDKLTEKLMEKLTEILSDNKRPVRSEEQRILAEEVEALRSAARDRETDLDTLHTVLHGNQDLIKELQAALGERGRLLTEVEKEREVWRQREQALAAVRREEEALIRRLRSKEAAAAGGGASLEETEQNSALLCEEVTKLTSALQEYQDMVQKQQQSFGVALASLQDELRETRRALREREREKKEGERAWEHLREDGRRRERTLRDSLMDRDTLIQQILLEAEERDRLLQESLGNLQQNLQQNTPDPLTAVKHTL